MIIEINQTIVQQIFPVCVLVFLSFICGVVWEGRKSANPLAGMVKELDKLGKGFKDAKNRKVLRTADIGDELKERWTKIEEYRVKLKNQEDELQRQANGHSLSVKQWWRDVQRELDIDVNSDIDLRYNEHDKKIEVLSSMKGDK